MRKCQGCHFDCVKSVFLAFFVALLRLVYVLQLIDGFALNYTVTGLEPRSKYIFQVRAFTVAGDGSPTGPKTVETLGAGKLN